MHATTFHEMVRYFHPNVQVLYLGDLCWTPLYTIEVEEGRISRHYQGYETTDLVANIYSGS